MQMQQQGAGGTDRRRGKVEDEEERVLATWDCGSPLYDSFELASLHHVLESHLMVLPFPSAAAVSRSRRFDNLGASPVPTLSTVGWPGRGRLEPPGGGQGGRQRCSGLLRVRRVRNFVEG
jgi:hypothetical protein